MSPSKNKEKAKGALPAMRRHSRPEDWSYQEMLLVLPEEILAVDLTAVEGTTAEVFCQTLVDSLGHYPPSCELRGIVLPLELRTKSFLFQEMLGLDILEWLRWYSFSDTDASVLNAVRHAPVLIFGAQSLGKALRRRPNLLLTSEGTQYVVAPNCERLTQFIDRVRRKDWQNLQPSDSSIKDALGTSIQALLRKTHHDLANDGYAAFSLITGYLELLAQVGHADATKRVSQVAADCQNLLWFQETRNKISLPMIRQYQALLGHHPTSPQRTFSDGDPDNALNIEAPLKRLILAHLAGALSDASILLVDDDQAKGPTDAVNLILNGKAFPAKPSVQVSWAESIEEAQSKLGTLVTNHSNILVMLDLRLRPEDANAPAPSWDSVRWLTQLYRSYPTIPVLIFSATRNLAVYQAVTAANPRAMWLHKPFPGDSSSPQTVAADFFWKIANCLIGARVLLRLPPNRRALLAAYWDTRMSGDLETKLALLNTALAEFLQRALQCIDRDDRTVLDPDDEDTFYFSAANAHAHKRWYNAIEQRLPKEWKFLLRRRLLLACYLASLDVGDDNLFFDRNRFLRLIASTHSTEASMAACVSPALLFRPDDVGLNSLIETAPLNVFAEWLLPEEVQALVLLLKHDDAGLQIDVRSAIEHILSGDVH